MIKNDNIIIRLATNDDAETISRVRSDAIQNVNQSYYEQSALDEWAGPVKERVKKLLSNAAGIRIVAEIDKKIVAYGELVIQENLLGACYVLSSVGGQGIGKTIVAELEQIAREKGLNYLQMKSSTNAAKFYIRCGYQVIEHGKHTMQSGTVMDCIMMRKDL